MCRLAPLTHWSIAIGSLWPVTSGGRWGSRITRSQLHTDTCWSRLWAQALRPAHTLKTKHADPRSGTTKSAAAVARASGSAQFKDAWTLPCATCLWLVNHSTCLPMIGRTFDSHRIMVVIVYFLWPESTANLQKAWFSQHFSWVCCCYLDFLEKTISASIILYHCHLYQTIYFLLWRSYTCIIFGLFGISHWVLLLGLRATGVLRPALRARLPYVAPDCSRLLSVIS